MEVAADGYQLAETMNVYGSRSGVFVPLGEFARVLGCHRPDEVVAMCGSGVTACHHLLAMEHAGLRGAKLYTGSWSGWISDPSRSVATGER